MAAGAPGKDHSCNHPVGRRNIPRRCANKSLAMTRLPWRLARRSRRCDRSAMIPWPGCIRAGQINEAQYRGGRAFQNDWERGPQAVNPRREYVDGVQIREPITEGQRKAVLRLNRVERELGADGSALMDRRWCTTCWWHDHGAGRSAAWPHRPAVEGLFLPALSGVPRSAGADFMVLQQAGTMAFEPGRRPPRPSRAPIRRMT